MKVVSFFLIFLFTQQVFGLDDFQGPDYDVEPTQCGAPLVLALRKKDPNKLLKDSSGKLQLKASLERISQENLNDLERELGTFSEEEKKLLDLIKNKFFPPSVHRTGLDTSKAILPLGLGLISATKRKVAPARTPNIEESLYGAADCIFSAVSLPYGIEGYGTVIFRFKHRRGFAWGTVYTGWTWVKDVLRKPLTTADDEMRRQFAKMVFTNNHWEEAIAYQIIGNVRKGISIRGLGKPYDKDTILAELLSLKNSSDFWDKVIYHRLGFLEGHYTDNVDLKDISYIQFREADKDVVKSWGLNPAWFDEASRPFIQFFPREK